MSWRKSKSGAGPSPLGYENDDTPSIQGTLFPEDLTRRQIDRCNRSASLDYEAFCRNVEILALNLPSSKLAELDEMKEDYTETKEVWVYKYNCGVQIGSPERPIKNRYGDLISPIRTEEEETDYYLMYRIVLRLLEEAGLSWKAEEEMIDGGEVEDETFEQWYSEATPTLPKEEAEEVEEAEGEEENELEGATEKT